MFGGREGGIWTKVGEGLGFEGFLGEKERKRDFEERGKLFERGIC